MLLKVIENSYKDYFRYGARSNKKLIGLHGFLASEVKKYLKDDSYSVHSLGFGDNKEKTVDGAFHKKRCDITISKNNEIKAAISIKSITTSFCKNANNYYEQMLGECSNLKLNGIDYYQILILPMNLPKKVKNEWKVEKIGNDSIEKYKMLNQINVDKNTIKILPSNILLCLVDNESLNETNVSDFTRGKVDVKFRKNYQFDLEFDNQSIVILNEEDVFFNKIKENLLH